MLHLPKDGVSIFWCRKLGLLLLCCVFFWNDFFRCELFDEEEHVAVAKIFERIKKASALYTVTVNPQGLKEYRVGGKTYIDARGLSFAAGMKVSFEAGFQGKEILTDHDWNTGRAEAILRGEI